MHRKLISLTPPASSNALVRVAHGGWGPLKVVTVLLFLGDMRDIRRFNVVCERMFGNER